MANVKFDYNAGINKLVTAQNIMFHAEQSVKEGDAEEGKRTRELVIANKKSTVLAIEALEKSTDPAAPKAKDEIKADQQLSKGVDDDLKSTIVAIGNRALKLTLDPSVESDAEKAKDRTQVTDLVTANPVAAEAAIRAIQTNPAIFKDATDADRNYAVARIKEDLRHIEQEVKVGSLSLQHVDSSNLVPAQPNTPALAKSAPRSAIG